MYKWGRQYRHQKELIIAVSQILDQFETVFVMVDAIDESNPWEDVLKSLRDFVLDHQFWKIQLLASSREYIDIERTMLTVSVSVSMANPYVEEDIRLRVRSMLKSNRNFKRWPLELLNEVEDAVSKGAKGMFRWAVCQIDALQQLKGERSIVNEALANLPKYLDETYDRILCTVPEEDQYFVQHALQWIRYHGELNEGKDISHKMLLQAIAKSAAYVHVDLRARYYDIETIQELCGCLVNAVSEPTKDPTTVQVSFAHFTVQEYLDSNRTSKNSTTFSTACKEKIWQPFTEVLFREFYQVRMSELCVRKSSETEIPDVFISMENHFDLYSVNSTFKSLRKHMDIISQQDALGALTFDLVNPSRQHYETVRDILSFFRLVDDAVWDDKSSDTVAIFLYNILQTSDSPSKQTVAARYFLEGKDARSLLPAHVKAKVPVAGIYCSFDGPLIDFLIFQSNIDILMIEVLLDSQDTLPSPSTLLISYSIRSAYQSIHSSVRRAHFVEHLFGRGANPDVLESRITPLQIASYTADSHIVKALLGAGANSNYTGNSDGIIQKENTFANHLNELHGFSPLHICRNNCLRSEDGEQDYIETKLLKYGARELEATDPS